jgi:hypothetical protein
MGSIIRSLITRLDLSLWDGVTRTVSRVDATGGTVTGITVGDFVDVLQVFGSGTDRTKTTIDSAKGFIGTGVNCTLMFATGNWTIDDDLTIPANFSVHIPAGCVFVVASTKTLTFAGPVHVEYSASDGTGWYTGDGVVLCSVGATGWPGW